MAGIVTFILNTINPDLVKKLFINQEKNNGRDIPMSEVRFKAIEWAKKARMWFVAQLKDGEDFGRIHMVNSVCLATWVRVDILKALQNSSQSQTEMQCMCYPTQQDPCCT
jgi:hypothetical protein